VGQLFTEKQSKKANLLYKIEPLSTQYDRTSFDCGVKTLNNYLQKQASQDVKRDVATLYVAFPVTDPGTKIAGYYSLSTTGVLHITLPESLQNKMPRYRMIPAVLLGRLAVDLRHQGHKLGTYLLYDAFAKSLASSIAWAFFVTDAKNEDSRAFYEHFGFAPLRDDPHHLFIARHEIQHVIKEPSHYLFD
jgi:GNAT superfamily N-acetyltransferase